MSKPMVPVWADGRKYRSVAAFLLSQGIDNAHFKRAYAVIEAAAANGKPCILDGFSYSVSFTNPEGVADKIRRIAKTAPASHKRRLLAGDYATCGLHQDKGEHYAD